MNIVEHDVTRHVEVSGDLDEIYHFASPASPADFESIPIQILKVGAMGTHNCLGLAGAKNARFMLASTSEVYGDPLVHPQPEEYWGNVNPVGTRGAYDEAKRYAEAITMAYHRYHGLDTRIVRIFNTYGSRMRPDDGRMIPNFMRQALAGESLTVYGDGKQTRSVQHVDDLIEGVLRLMRSDGTETGEYREFPRTLGSGSCRDGIGDLRRKGRDNPRTASERRPKATLPGHKPRRRGARMEPQSADRGGAPSDLRVVCRASSNQQSHHEDTLMRVPPTSGMIRVGYFMRPMAGTTLR